MEKPKRSTKNLWFPVPSVKLSDLPDLSQLEKEVNPRPPLKGCGVRIKVNMIEVALFRHGNHVFACDAVCPHAGGPLELGDVEDLCLPEPRVVCPHHHYKYNLVTGQNVFPKTAPAIEIYPVRVGGNGSLFVAFANLASTCFNDENF